MDGAVIPGLLVTGTISYLFTFAVTLCRVQFFPHQYFPEWHLGTKKPTESLWSYEVRLAKSMLATIEREGVSVLWRRDRGEALRASRVEGLSYATFACLHYSLGLTPFPAGIVSGIIGTLVVYPHHRASFLAMVQNQQINHANNNTRKNIKPNKNVAHVSAEDVAKKLSRTERYKGMEIHMGIAASYRAASFGVYYWLRREDYWPINFALAWGATFASALLFEPFHEFALRRQLAEITHGEAAAPQLVIKSLQESIKSQSNMRTLQGRLMYRQLFLPAGMTLFFFDYFASSMRSRAAARVEAQIGGIGEQKL